MQMISIGFSPNARTKVQFAQRQNSGMTRTMAHKNSLTRRYPWNSERSMSAQLEAQHARRSIGNLSSTMNILPRIKDYKNPFHGTPTWADYHRLLSSLHSQ